MIFNYNKNRDKQDEELKFESDSEEISTKLPFFTPFLLLIFGIVIFFKATLYSNKFNRLNVFQVKDNLIRRNIIEILQISGYEHFNGLQKKLKIGVSILLWHLEVLEDFEIIETIKFVKVTKYLVLREKTFVNLLKDKISNFSNFVQ